MSEKEKDPKKTLTLGGGTRFFQKKEGVERVQQQFSHGRKKTVEVETPKKRVRSSNQGYEKSIGLSGLTKEEVDNRLKAIQSSKKHDGLEEKKEVGIKRPELVLGSNRGDSKDSNSYTRKEENKTSEKSTLKIQEKDSSNVANTLESQNIQITKDDSELAQSKSRNNLDVQKDSPIVSAKDKPQSSFQSNKKPVSADQNERPNLRNKEKNDFKVDRKKTGAQTASPTFIPPVPIDPAPFDGKAHDLRRSSFKKEPNKDSSHTQVKRKNHRHKDTSFDFSMPKKLTISTLSGVLESDGETDELHVRRPIRRSKKEKKDFQAAAPRVIRDVIIPDFISVNEFASRMALRASDVVKSLMKMGLMISGEQKIDGDTAELICLEFKNRPVRVRDDAVESAFNFDTSHLDQKSRPPVVTVMGHVDHGKTSLLDAIRQTSVVKKEAGGITQHIGAYQVVMASGKRITFVDTPGHAAFTQMRARGANVTDVVVLVVAADDGIMAQTIEAIQHARAAEVPIIVAVNKMDKPEANLERVKQDLLSHNLIVEEFGGDILCVPVSAKTKMGLDVLEESILLQAELMELKAPHDCPAQGVILESRIDKGRGAVVDILVQKGVLKVGVIIVAGEGFGKVRAIVDDMGDKRLSAEPSLPVEILGFSGAVSAGDPFCVVENETKAREICDSRIERKKNELLSVQSAGGALQGILDQIAQGAMKELPIIIKADVHGSMEAIVGSIQKQSDHLVKPKILISSVGAISESDVALAKSANSVVLAFNVRATPKARELAQKDHVDIRYYSVIYDLLNDVEHLLDGMLDPTFHEKILGYAEIRTVFSISDIGNIAGSYITQGLVKRGAKIRLLRDNIVIHAGDIKTLRRFKDDVKEVKESYECGIAFENYNDIKVGDIIECFEMEEKKKTA